MTKKTKSMTTILVIIVVIILMYVGAWIRVGLMIDINLGCKTTYFPKHGLPFVWIVTITPDSKLPKLSSGCEATQYEVNIFSRSPEKIL